MRVHKVESVVNRNHTIWFEPEEGEDWGTLTDDVYGRNRSFKPNLLCVLVAESNGQVHAYWSQAREEHFGEGWTRCDGTYAVESRHDIPDGRGWWWDALAEAEKMVRAGVPDA